MPIMTMLEIMRWPPLAAPPPAEGTGRGAARGRGEREMLVEHRAHLFRAAGHCIDPARAAQVEPRPDLRHAHLALPRRHADACERLRQLRARQANERGLRRRLIALERRLFDEAPARRRGHRRRNGHGLRFAHRTTLRLSSIDGVPGPPPIYAGHSPFNPSLR